MGSKKRAPETVSFHPFQNLKEIIERKRIAGAVDPSKVEKPERLSDEELFAAAMKEVREIEEYRQIPVQPKKIVPMCGCRIRRYDAVRVLEEVVNGRVPINLPDTEEYVEWVNPAYLPACYGNPHLPSTQHATRKRFECSAGASITKKLHSGAYSVQDCLDLHGLVVEEAEAAIGRLLKEALVKGLWCIKIIHGRGLRSPDGPVLKSALIAWLTNRYRKNVIAFASARQCDGGLGALYVLLIDPNNAVHHRMRRENL